MAQEALDVVVDQSVQVIAVSAGSSHSVALLDCDLVVSWGRGEDGQLGHGDANEYAEPKAIHSLIQSGVTSISCGAEYTIAVSKPKRAIYSWGWGDFGRLGHGNCSDVFVPQQISVFSGIGVKLVACGDTHTLLVTENGELFSFGRNQNGQLGLGHNEDALSPQLVRDLQADKQAVTSIACGAEHSIAATVNGEVFCWGWGRYGNLGDGHRTDRWNPTKALGLEGVNVDMVACGWRHSAVVSTEGKVYTFGWSKYGQLGHGDFSDHLTATQVTGLSDKVITTVAGGWRHTMAADEEGNVYSWGWNKFGQLGHGDTEDRNAPSLIQALVGQKVSTVACGWRHAIAVTEDGQVYTWGRGVNGQLGHGAEEDLSTPKRLEFLSKGTANRAKILATASASGGYVSPADRYAVVPDGDDLLGGNGAMGLPQPYVQKVPAVDAPLQKKQRTSEDVAPY